MEFNDIFSPAFVQDDLIVQYYVCKEDVIEEKYSSFSQNFYIMMYNISGISKIIANDDTIQLKPGEIFLANRGTIVKKTNLTKETKSISAFFLPCALKDNENDFLRVFHENKYIVFNIEKFERKLCISAVHSLYHCIFEHRSRFEFILRLQIVISELNFVYDKTIGRKSQAKDNLTVTVIEYIENHYTENITLKTLADKFFISDKTINRMCKAMRSQTFHNLLNSLRLKEAENFMKTNKKSLAKVAELSGFHSYSSFFRAYKAKYGTAPAQSKNPKQYHWPLDNK